MTDSRKGKPRALRANSRRTAIPNVPLLQRLQADLEGYSSADRAIKSAATWRRWRPSWISPSRS